MRDSLIALTLSDGSSCYGRRAEKPGVWWLRHTMGEVSAEYNAAAPGWARAGAEAALARGWALGDVIQVVEAETSTKEEVGVMTDIPSPLWAENTRLKAVVAEQRKHIAELEAALAAVPVEALRWIDRSYVEGFWDEGRGPDAYAALHAWVAEQGKAQP